MPTDTRERILHQALALFAREGYEAVSMRDIAGRLGLSQSALYKHYANKRAIFEAIVARMERADYARAADFAVPARAFTADAAAYRETALESVRRFSLAQFAYWTRDPFAAAFRRMLTLEQYRSPEMTALYQQYLGGGVVDYMEDLFREMRTLGGGADEPRRLALAFYAPMYLLMNLCDAAQDDARRQALHAQATAHIDGFLAGLAQK